jgi:hypothetical protein
MGVLALTARGFLAITFVAVSMHAGSAQTPALDCTQDANLPLDETSIAISLQGPSSPRIESARAEAACRAAVASDPSNPTFMFRFARALCMLCGEEMRLAQTVPDDTMIVPGFEYHILNCP